MKRAFVFKDEKSHKFWWIDYSGCDFAVNYGKAGAHGKYEIKEFESEAECEKQAEKLIASKLKKGYKETEDFDFNNRFYFDDEEIGLHPKTSHPNFSKHFTDELYYDCGDEEAPFGSDEGSDTLYEMTEKLRKKPDLKFCDMPRMIIEDVWGMNYVSVTSLKEDDIKEQLKEDEMNITQSDMVTYAVAFGEIKITGKITAELKENALKAMKRFKITAKILEWGEESNTLNKMIAELDEFKILE